MKVVLITGASGFIASHAAAALADGGHRVIGVSRDGGDVPGFEHVYRAALGESIVEVLDQSAVDVVIHTANHAGDGEYDINVAGTTRWHHEAASAGVGLQILLSTLGAASDAESAYARAKHALERVFADAGDISLRLGVVAGPGGMYERIRRSVGASIMVPLLDNGVSPVYLLGIDSLTDVLCDLVVSGGDGRRGRVWSLQQPEPVTLRALMNTIRREHGYRCVFVPVPSLPVLWALTMLEQLHVDLPVRTTNIRGLRAARHQSFASDFETFGGKALSLDELVRLAKG